MLENNSMRRGMNTLVDVLKGLFYFFCVPCFLWKKK